MLTDLVLINLFPKYFLAGFNWMLEKAFSLIDLVISWIFRLVPDDFILDFINPYIYDFFDYITSLLLNFSYWIDVSYFAFLLWTTFLFETFYIIIRFIVWISFKVIKP